MEGLNLVSGLEVGFGGVWVGAAPYLLFVPDKDGDDKPDGQPQILLDGWGYQDTHETLNTFIWGPDGWLYGCHGVFTHSPRRQAGHAGRGPHRRSTPASGAITRRGTSSRSSPTARATRGASTSTSTARSSSRRASSRTASTSIQGGRYQRQAGQHFNPYTYADIKTIADHRHYVGAEPARRQQPLRRAPAAATPTAG